MSSSSCGGGCLAFHIGWPLGCMSQGLLWEEGELREKKVFIGWSWRGQRYELRDGKTWCNGCLLGFNAAKDKSVSSRNEDGQAWH